MGFFSELKTLASEIGDIAKDCGQEIGDIIDDTKQEFKDDPKKFTIDSLKDVGSAVGSAAVFVGKSAIEEGKKNIDKKEQYKDGMAELSDNDLFRILIEEKEKKTLKPLKYIAAMDILKERDYSEDDIKDRIF